MPYGVTSTGFVPKTLPTIRTEIEDALRATFGPSINLTPQSNFGQIVGIIAEREAELWQLAEGVYHAHTADGATGLQLDNVAALTGTVREPPSLSRVLATVTGTAGTSIPAGRVVSVAGTGARFENVADVVIPPGGTLAGVEFRAQVAGPTPVYAGTLTVIETPVAGWSSVVNPADHFKLGTDLETDAALRVRRELELRAQGNAALEAVRQSVLDVPDVTECYVFENTTGTADADGLPSHSFEVLAQGGEDEAIRAAIYSAKAAGITAHGSNTGTVADSQGLPHPIAFSRPEVLSVYVAITVSTDPAAFPADGAEQIKAAIASYGDARFRVGSDVISSALGAQAFKVSGVVDVLATKIGTAPAPGSSANIVTTLRQLPALDTARITVTIA